MTRLYAKLVGAMLMGMSSAVVLADGQASPPAVANQPAPAVRSIPRVEVFLFTAVSGAPVRQDWTGRGIQENLQSDVSRTGATLTLAPHNLAPTDEPIAIAKENHADLAVTGSYQVVGDQIRANGQLIDVATNTSVGGFSATGAQHDLFKIEDALGEQLRGLLPRPAPIVQMQPAIEQPPTAAVTYDQPTAGYIQPSTPAVYNNYYETAATPSYYYPSYSYPAYDYSGYNGGYYNGGYSGFGYFPGFVSVGFGHDHDRGREGGRDRDGFHDHGFVGGGVGDGVRAGRGGSFFGNGNGGSRGNFGGNPRGVTRSSGNNGGFGRSPGGSVGGHGGFAVGRTGGANIGFGGSMMSGGRGGGGHR